MPINIIDFIASLLAAAFLLRGLLQLFEADFYHPLSQTIVKVTSPLVEPLRRLLPNIGKFNTAAFVSALLMIWVGYVLQSLGSLDIFNLFILILPATIKLLYVLVDIYFWGIIIIVIASWVGTMSHPNVALVLQIIDPYLAVFRRFIPPIGMLDLSVMVAIIALYFIERTILPLLYSGLRSIL